MMTTIKGAPFTKNTMSFLFTDVFNCGFSCVRKSYLSNKYQKIFELEKKMKEDSVSMMHSGAIQRSHYLQMIN